MNTMTGVLHKLLYNLPTLGLVNWWIQITTTEPTCIYYFGPFSKAKEADEKCPEYIEDLTSEGAQEIEVKLKLKRRQPAELTKFSED